MAGEYHLQAQALIKKSLRLSSDKILT